MLSSNFNFVSSTTNVITAVLILEIAIPVLIIIYVLIKLHQIARNSKLIKEELQRLNANMATGNVSIPQNTAVHQNDVY